MIDLFETEQKILDDAVCRVNELWNGASCQNEEFINLVKEYRGLLKQLRRVTRISDRTTIDLNATNSELLDIVHYDTMTGIYNKRYLEDSLKRIVRSLSRSGDPLTVMMLNIDFFKRYNDVYGRSKGDECLKALATVLCDCLFRADDFAARCDNDDFAIVLPNTDAKGAVVIANRIIENIQANNIPHAQSDIANHVTVSIGVVADSSRRKQGYDDYLKQAEEALYISKQSGRNKYTITNIGE